MEKKSTLQKLLKTSHKIFSFQKLLKILHKNHPSKNCGKSLTQRIPTEIAESFPLKLTLQKLLKISTKIIPPKVAENLSPKLFLQKLLKISRVTFFKSYTSKFPIFEAPQKLRKIPQFSLKISCRNF